MKHAYLFIETVWQACGRYVDEKGREVEVVGSFSITHSDDVWTCDSAIEIASEKGRQYQQQEEHNTQVIMPFTHHLNHTPWQSANQASVRLQGQFVLCEETILSVAQTRSGKLHSVENFIQVNDEHYHNRGVLMESGKKSSSWILELHREA